MDYSNTDRVRQHLADNLKKILITNFEENFDYIIDTIKKKHTNTNKISIYDIICSGSYFI
jgi:hypothetical protein